MIMNGSDMGHNSTTTRVNLFVFQYGCNSDTQTFEPSTELAESPWPSVLFSHALDDLDEAIERCLFILGRTSVLGLLGFIGVPGKPADVLEMKGLLSYICVQLLGLGRAGSFGTEAQGHQVPTSV